MIPSQVIMLVKLPMVVDADMVVDVLVLVLATLVWCMLNSIKKTFCLQFKKLSDIKLYKLYTKSFKNDIYGFLGSGWQSRHFHHHSCFHHHMLVEARCISHLSNGKC